MPNLIFLNIVTCYISIDFKKYLISHFIDFSNFYPYPLQKKAHLNLFSMCSEK
jgi:hypothetical protein